MYGGTIGYFMINDPSSADEIYEQKLKTLYDQDSNSLRTPLSYYDSNWAWFGLALYNDLLPNLAEK
jgi:endoglucanase